MPLITIHHLRCSHSVKCCLVQSPRLFLKGNASGVGKAAGSWCEAVLSLTWKDAKQEVTNRWTKNHCSCTELSSDCEKSREAEDTTIFKAWYIPCLPGYGFTIMFVPQNQREGKKKKKKGLFHSCLIITSREKERAQGVQRRKRQHLNKDKKNKTKKNT